MMYLKYTKIFVPLHINRIDVNNYFMWLMLWKLCLNKYILLPVIFSKSSLPEHHQILELIIIISDLTIINLIEYKSTPLITCLVK